MDGGIVGEKADELKEKKLFQVKGHFLHVSNIHGWRKLYTFSLVTFINENVSLNQRWSLVTLRKSTSWVWQKEFWAEFDMK